LRWAEAAWPHSWWASADFATPLHKAVANDFVKAVELLDDEGADWGARHRSGVTPTHLARRKPHLTHIGNRKLAA
jgi:ankyrin repeat protein